jgi:hypothetical protein
LDNYYSPSALEARITEWVDYYNNHRYHEAIDNVTPHDRYLGLDRKILKQRKKTKAKSIRLRRRLYQSLSLKSLIESLKKNYNERAKPSLEKSGRVSELFDDIQLLGI